MARPNRVLVTFWTTPAPLQVGQVFTSDAFLVPRPPHSGQGRLRSMVTSFSQPFITSSRVTFTRVRMSRPRWVREACWPPPKPPNPSKPPKPPKPPKAPPKRLLRISLRLPKPWLQSWPAAPSTPANPNWSYFARLSGSLSTEYASEASLNLSSAVFFSASVPLTQRSGCHLSAALR